MIRANLFMSFRNLGYDSIRIKPCLTSYWSNKTIYDFALFINRTVISVMLSRISPRPIATWCKTSSTSLLCMRIHSPVFYVSGKRPTGACDFPGGNTPHWKIPNQRCAFSISRVSRGNLPACSPLHIPNSHCLSKETAFWNSVESYFW